MMVEDAANTPHLIITVAVDKIFITPCLVSGIFFLSERIHGIAKSLVKMPGIFFKEIIGRKIRASAKPPVDQLSVCSIYFKITPVGMGGGNIGVDRIDRKSVV